MNIKCTSGLFHAFHQLVGDVRTFKAHDALFRAPETQQINAPVPYDPLIDDGELLMDAGAEYQTHSGLTQQIQSPLQGCGAFFSKVFHRSPITRTLVRNATSSCCIMFNVRFLVRNGLTARISLAAAKLKQEISGGLQDNTETSVPSQQHFTFGRKRRELRRKGQNI